ncbi:general transcription factor II-I repeat domain-containing protein 2B-like [Prorops nasuta]|uniref:general transcription factor II-I repeat domain-containing protein 2B-like n=1 Tax=Prorops nasuta TaxID=863751 RepID=UPI0034CD8BEF
MSKYNYSIYKDDERRNLIERLKLVLKQYSDEPPNLDIVAQTSSFARKASYDISLLIAQRGKPFVDGEFIKSCLLKAVNAFGGSLTVDDVLQIPLSDKTVATRVQVIAGSIEEKFKSLLQSCVYFSLYLNESTDNRHVSQLSIFVRIVGDDFSYTKELLDFFPLHGTTTGADIFSTVENTFEKFNINFSKCSCIVTDGASSMVGTRKGFAGQLFQRNIKVPLIHCIIHQEALCGKAIKITAAMKMVTKIINFIKGGNRSLTHRQFKLFLAEHDSLYKDIPLYSDVRWLSAGQCLERFLALKNEIMMFLQIIAMASAMYNEFKSFLEDIDSLCELALITDLTNHLNTLNYKLQTSEQSSSQLVSHIDSFIAKLNMLMHDLIHNSFYHFPACKYLLEESAPNTCDFKKHFYILQSIIEEFTTRFKDLQALRKDLILYENVFFVPIEEQNVILREELCDLQNDISLHYLKNKFQNSLEIFKTLPKDKYPFLRSFGLRIFSMFGSTYLCECSFSKMKQIKNDLRSSMNDSTLTALMRTYLTNIEIDTFSLVPPVTTYKPN